MKEHDVSAMPMPSLATANDNSHFANTTTATKTTPMAWFQTLPTGLALAISESNIGVELHLFRTVFTEKFGKVPAVFSNSVSIDDSDHLAHQSERSVTIYTILDKPGMRAPVDHIQQLRLTL